MASITRLFIREHRQEILDCLFDFHSTIDSETANEEQQAVYYFAKAVSSVLATLRNVPTVLGCKNSFSLTSERKAFLFMFDEVALDLKEYYTYEDIELVFDFITTDIISDYMSVIYQHLHELRPGMAYDLRELGKDNEGVKFVNAMLYNKPSDDYIGTKSKFLLVERYSFVSWMAWKGEGHPKGKSKQKLQSLYERFVDTSWFSLLLNIDENPENLDYTLNGIIEDYTGIKDKEASEILHTLLLCFATAIQNFKRGENYVVEQDDRDHVCGICFPQERTYLEWRIKFASDYIVDNGYIADNDKEIFRKVMMGDTQGSVEFKHGKSLKGEPKKKGGKTVLYWIIRYIKEPESFYNNDKSDSYKDFANCFYFTADGVKELCDFTSLADTGKSNIRVADDLRKLFKHKEEKFMVDITI